MGNDKDCTWAGVLSHKDILQVVTCRLRLLSNQGTWKSTLAPTVPPHLDNYIWELWMNRRNICSEITMSEAGPILGWAFVGKACSAGKLHWSALHHLSMGWSKVLSLEAHLSFKLTFHKLSALCNGLTSFAKSYWLWPFSLLYEWWIVFCEQHLCSKLQITIALSTVEPKAEYFSESTWQPMMLLPHQNTSNSILVLEDMCQCTRP